LAGGALACGWRVADGGGVVANGVPVVEARASRRTGAKRPLMLSRPRIADLP